MPRKAALHGMPQAIEQRLRVRGVGAPALRRGREGKRYDEQFAPSSAARQLVASGDLGDGNVNADLRGARAQQCGIGNNNETGHAVARREREA